MESVKKRLKMKPAVGDGVFVAESADVIGEVELKDNSSVWFNVVLRGDVEKITIGKCSNVQDGTVIHTTLDKYPTVVGDYVTIGHNAMLHGCTIEENVLVGIGAVILDNSVVGKNTIVAAGALIPPGKKYPPNSLLMGSPAKVAKTLSEEDVQSIRDYADRYLKYKQIYIEEGFEAL